MRDITSDSHSLDKWWCTTVCRSIVMGIIASSVQNLLTTCKVWFCVFWGEHELLGVCGS